MIPAVYRQLSEMMRRCEDTQGSMKISKQFLDTVLQFWCDATASSQKPEAKCDDVVDGILDGVEDVLRGSLKQWESYNEARRAP